MFHSFLRKRTLIYTIPYMRTAQGVFLSVLCLGFSFCRLTSIANRWSSCGHFVHIVLSITVPGPRAHSSLSLNNVHTILDKFPPCWGRNHYTRARLDHIIPWHTLLSVDRSGTLRCKPRTAAPMQRIGMFLQRCSLTSRAARNLYHVSYISMLHRSIFGPSECSFS